MNLTEQQRKEFEAVARPMIEWLNNNSHPHASVIIDTIHAELLEGCAVVSTNDYVKG